MKKILAFRIDRLGDYIICSNLLYELKKKFGHLTIVCSENNYKLIKNQKFIDEVIIFDKKYSLIKKIKIFLKIISQKYYLILCWDGKKFSFLTSIFARSKFKLGIYYVKIKKILGINISLHKPNKFFNKLIFDKSLRFTSRSSLINTEHLGSIYFNLVKNFLPHLQNNNKYYLDISKSSEDEFLFLKNKYEFSNYLLIHLDEKWLDILNIENDLYNSIKYLSDKLKYKVIITAFKNSNTYYNNLKKSLNNNFDKNIIIFEDLKIDLFERLINYSNITISCHSGFVVQSAGFNNVFIIDIINENEALWVSCWKPLIDNYLQIFKNNDNKRKVLINIFDEIIALYEKKKI